MADVLKKVQPGDKLRVPAAAYNAFIDTTMELRRRQQCQEQSGTPQQKQSGIVLLRNDSGEDRQRFDVLGISNTVITPSDNLDTFKNQIVLAGVKPTVANHIGKFAILLEPVANTKIAQAVIAGVSIVHVNVTDDSHRFADIADNDATQLKSSRNGSVVILWKEAGTGSKWAVVRLGGSAANTFLVKITKDGGVAGNCSTDCSFTYTVKDVDGNVLGTAVMPAQKRIPKCKYNQPANGSLGLALYDPSGNLILYSAAEEYPAITFTSTTVVTGIVCNGDGTISVSTTSINAVSCA